MQKASPGGVLNSSDTNEELMTERHEDRFESEEGWVRSAQAGDAEAFAGLVRRYFGSVYAVAYGILANREAAEDLAQEVFLRVFLNLKSLRDARTFGPWVLRAARNLAFDWRK